MSKPPRIDRKTLKNPDEFVSRGRSVLTFLASQRSRFIPILVVAGVVIAAAYAYDWWVNDKLEKGWQAYANAMKAVENERWDKLKTLHADLKSGRPSLFAALALGDHYFDEAKKETLKDPKTVPPSAAIAGEWYAKALQSSDLLPAEKQLLQSNRGAAFELEQKWDDAKTAYTSASDQPGEGKALALLGLARVAEAKNDPAVATQTYEKVTTEFSNTEYAKIARNSLRRLKSPLFQKPNS